MRVIACDTGNSDGEKAIAYAMLSPGQQSVLTDRPAGP